MKQVFIICEGYSELLFCKEILALHLKKYSIKLNYELTSQSKDGGITKWINIKDQIIRINNQNPDAIITTFLDYYGIDKSHKFPSWADSKLISDKSERISILENGMKNDFESTFNFIPYIQLHEFEALVFSDYNAFELLYDKQDADLDALKKICLDYPNPEEINDIKVTAPSNRLIKNINRYNKKESGIDLLSVIGLEKIRNKCPRFNNWILKLETI